MADKLNELLATVPDPGVSALDHLRHTLAVYSEIKDSEMAISATSGIYAVNGKPVRTGLTWGDLRELLAGSQHHDR
jgi:hypothetical protein